MKRQKAALLQIHVQKLITCDKQTACLIGAYKIKLCYSTSYACSCTSNNLNINLNHMIEVQNYTSQIYSLTFRLKILREDDFLTDYGKLFHNLGGDEQNDPSNMPFLIWVLLESRM